MKGVIFDVDGVIIDVRDSYHTAILETVKYFSDKELTKEYVREYKYKRAINNDWDVTYELLRENGISVEYDRLVEVFESIYRENRDKERLLLTRDFFETLKERDIPLGVVTGRPKEALMYAFRKFNLLDIFDITVDEDDIEDPFLRKPNPFPLHMAVEIMGVDEFIYIGDTPADGDMIYFYRKMYGKPCKLIHYKEVQDMVDIGADMTAVNRDQLLNLLLSEVSLNREVEREYLP